ncbi:uncharacterized protein ZBAI_03576 [Zygosaccharomyces bailii ISA1307]|nr:uncharacterized protein ZBAI_03576 [Zygosaccharomyces bailii ISA1307]
MNSWTLYFGIFLLGLIKKVEATAACLPSSSSSSGFTAKFYQYDFGDESTFSTNAYMASGYADRELLNTESGITNILIAYGMECDLSDGTTVTPSDPWNFDYGQCEDGYYIDSEQTGTVYGYTLDATNFTVELTGYFLAPQTGPYSVQINHVDDGAILDLGTGVAFDCCLQDASPVGNTEFSINAIKPESGQASSATYTVDMVAGYYYPIKIVYTNSQQIGFLYTTITLPDGKSVSNDFSGYVYSFENEIEQPACTVSNPAPFVTSTAATPWTGTYTTTYATSTKLATDSSSGEEGEVIYYVETPTTPPILTTEYSGYSGSETSTYSTESTWVTGTDGNTTPETIYHVEPPTTPPILTTEYTAYSGSEASTYSTESTWVTGTDGNTTPETIYHVEPPTTPPILTTEYTAYSGSETSTYSTESTWVTGTDGNTTPETIYHVETPTTPPILTTEYSGYSGSETSTYSTESTWVTGTDGNTTPETIYHVETPTTPPILTTEYTAYSGSETSTYSTESTWVTGTDGNTTPETIYHVETPTTPPILTTEYTAYSGSETSTYSTESTWVTGTDGNTTPETIYHVETPTTPPILTTEYTAYSH